VLDRVIQKCLAKEPAERWQSAKDLHDELAWVAETALRSSSAAALALSRQRWTYAGWILAAVAVLFAIGTAFARPRLKPPGVVTFTEKTFDLRPIMNARFMPDGQTIVYSALSHGVIVDLFVIRPDSEAPQPLGVSKAQLLSVSSKGELAIITNAQYILQRLFAGTLARMTLGSAPRPIAEHVREADWSPDGSSLAIVHDLSNGRDRLEYPAGTALHEVSGYLSDPRVSPEGGRVAFFEHQWRFDDRGWVKVVDRAGHVTTLAGEYSAMEGLAWTPDGATVVFSASQAGGFELAAMSVPAAGGSPARPALGVPGRFVVYDVARDGRWLAARDDFRYAVRARVRSQTTERDLSWLGGSVVAGLSADGEWLLLTDMSPGAGKNYGVVLRKTDGSPAVRLGEGLAQQLSPDGNWAAALIATPPQLVIYPTGPGEPVRLNRGPIDRYQSAQWFPDSRRLLACGSEPSRPTRCYVQDVAGARPTPVTPEGVVGTLAPDGRTLLLTLSDGTRQVTSIGGDAAQPVVDGLRENDRVIGWTRDSGFVFVQRELAFDSPASIERVELATGRRTIVRQVAPEGPGLGPGSIAVLAWADEGRSLAYSHVSSTSTLFMVSGAVVGP
jgi:eukaryotic-like serine/threonine-protein kinase